MLRVLHDLTNQDQGHTWPTYAPTRTTNHEGETMRQTKAQRQAQWMTEFNDQVISRDAVHAGRIDWPTAQHFYFTGLTPVDAATRYLANAPTREGGTHAPH